MEEQDHYRRSRRSSPPTPPPPRPRHHGLTGLPAMDGHSESYLDPRERLEGENESFYRARSGKQSQLGIQDIDGVCNPAEGKNYTLQLQLKLHEDLDEYLEEFAYLTRLGNFQESTKLYAERLHKHSAKPYIQIQYAEMLLAQGDHNAVTDLLDARVGEEKLEDLHIDGFSDYDTLLLYRVLINRYARSFGRRRSQENPAILGDALLMVETILEEDLSTITSTQVKILALLMQLSSRFMYGSTLIRRLANSFSHDRCKSLYTSLLQQGRVWDMRDFLASLIPFDGIHSTLEALFNCYDVRNGVQELINDWTGHDKTSTDLSTLLALLDLLTTVASDLQRFSPNQDSIAAMLEAAIPLTNSILLQYSPAMTSRSYATWILEKARADYVGSNTGGGQLRKLHSYAGFATLGVRTCLPQYVPIEVESLQWGVEVDAKPEIREPVLLVLRTAQELNDHHLEASARQFLLVLSAEPGDQFIELASRLRSSGDIQSYVEVLVSRFLVCHTSEEKQELVKDLQYQLALPDCSSYLDPDTVFIAWSLEQALLGVSDLEKVLYNEAQTRRDRGHLSTSMMDLIERRLPLGRNAYNHRMKQINDDSGIYSSQYEDSPGAEDAHHLAGDLGRGVHENFSAYSASPPSPRTMHRRRVSTSPLSMDIIDWELHQEQKKLDLQQMRVQRLKLVQEEDQLRADRSRYYVPDSARTLEGQKDSHRRDRPVVTTDRYPHYSPPKAESVMESDYSLPEPILGGRSR